MIPSTKDPLMYEFSLFILPSTKISHVVLQIDLQKIFLRQRDIWTFLYRVRKQFLLPELMWSLHGHRYRLRQKLFFRPEGPQYILSALIHTVFDKKY